VNCAQYHQSIEDCKAKKYGLLADLHPIRYTVLASEIPGVFNLGGQLALFREVDQKRKTVNL